MGIEVKERNYKGMGNVMKINFYSENGLSNYSGNYLLRKEGDDWEVFGTNPDFVSAGIKLKDRLLVEAKEQGII